MFTKILKFGGSSVKNADNIARVVSIVSNAASQTDSLVVVVSAMGGVTDSLLTLIRRSREGERFESELQAIYERHRQALIALSTEGPELNEVLAQFDDILGEITKSLQGMSLLKETSKRSVDLVISAGERLSALIVAEALRARNLRAVALDARGLIITDDSYSAARVNFPETNSKISGHNFSGITVVTGFIGATKSGETTTLGRGGSDYTAAIFGAALGADEVQIWTDVSGVMTADPRLVPRAFSIPELTYEETMELCHFGAKVIYPPTIQPLFDKRIALTVKNTFEPDHPGTRISATVSEAQGDKVELSSAIDRPVSGISSISRIALITLQGSGLIGVSGTASRLFGALAERKVSVILISQASSEHSICFAVTPSDIDAAIAAISQEFAAEIALNQIQHPIAERELSIVAIVGQRMRRTPGVSGRLFQALGKNGVNVVAIAQGSSELNISVVVPTTHEAKALNALHDAFFLSGEKTINLFVAGAGGVGSELLRQISANIQRLRDAQQLELRLVSVANSRKMLVRPSGISLSSWESELALAEEFDRSRYIDQILTNNLANSVFIDCTASEELTETYESLLSKSISIVTPNKRANSGPFLRYKRLKHAARKGNVQFLYETNVGAGLPVLSTLADLRASGDTLISIEAVLSGTLSYLFNTFGVGDSFGALLLRARELGYTEPDPRDDLSGSDVRRKLLILARDGGLALEESSIEVENLVPQALLNTPLSEFLSRATELDDKFSSLVKGASAESRVLRYIARVDFETSVASIRLTQVDSEHPFYSLSGSDNVISFITDRYRQRPLVIKGPGAGNSVTAAGIMADLLRAASYL